MCLGTEHNIPYLNLHDSRTLPVKELSSLVVCVVAVLPRFINYKHPLQCWCGVVQGDYPVDRQTAIQVYCGLRCLS